VGDGVPSGSVSRDLFSRRWILRGTHVEVHCHGPVTQNLPPRTTRSTAAPMARTEATLSHNSSRGETPARTPNADIEGILTWRGRGSCSPKRVINKARRLIEYTALHAAVCGRLWLQLRLYVRRIIFVRVGLCACRRPRTQETNKKKDPSACVCWCGSRDFT
jgi:hypothetical protein